jgi:hypothetical protein
MRGEPLPSSARRAWKEKRLVEIAARVAQPSWPSNELARLNAPSAAGTNTESRWLSDHIILTRSGEWLAYAAVCQKEDERIPDLFLARGSDGRWYYSTFHFCINLLNLRMEEQPEDLASFTKTYYLISFDGKSDECLQKTFPPKRN